MLLFLSWFMYLITIISNPFNIVRTNSLRIAVPVGIHYHNNNNNYYYYYYYHQYATSTILRQHTGGNFRSLLTTGTVQKKYIPTRRRQVDRLSPQHLFSSSIQNENDSSDLTEKIDQQQSTTTTTTAERNKKLQSPSSSSPPIILLKRNVQSRTFRDGNQLIYRKSLMIETSSYSSIDKQQHAATIFNNNVPQKLSTSIQTGDIVQVHVEQQDRSNPKNHKNKNYKNKNQTNDASTTKVVVVPPPTTTPIGFGIYNIHSLYTIRLLCHTTLQPKLYHHLCTIIKEQEQQQHKEQHHNELSHNTKNVNEILIRTIVHYHINAAIRLRQCQLLGVIVSPPPSSVHNNNSYIQQEQQKPLLPLPPPLLYSDTYRLFNGEGDGMSGLAIDVIGHSNIVVMSSAIWCEIYKDIIIEVVYELCDTKLVSVQAPANHSNTNIQIIWKTAPSRLIQDGMTIDTTNHTTTTTAIWNNKIELDDDNDDKKSFISKSKDNDDNTYSTEQLEEEQQEHPMVLSIENGILYETYPSADGQKTGVYSDQRTNRYMISQYCSQKRVLDLCCYTGGFSFNAIVHGNATSCTGVDSSPIAIATCYANAQRNHISPDRISFVQSDITLYLQQSIRDGIEYDIVILDPPKLAPSIKLLDKAKRKYHALNRDAISIINNANGGLLLSCTCSAAMTQADGGQIFLKMIQTAAQACQKHVTLLSVHGAAPCHTQSPMAYPASNYLTAALFYVHPKI
jgi:23S rRNA G2069 N7-methylase RlmK/C1962 C5-methylase RlmI